MPLVSVIVPVYNVEHYRCRCVDSILAQTFTDFELILVDDGSPDNCGVICDEYAEKDNRIHVIHQENGGLSAARNAGIDWAFANSDSQWLAFVDSDDWVHPEYLAYLYRAVQENDVKVSVCGYHETAERDIAHEDMEYQAQTLPWEDLFLKQNLKAILAWNKLYAKELFQGLRYPVGKTHEDEFLTYKLISQHPKLALVYCDLYYYYINMDGISRRPFSLKRMDRIEACLERLTFFRDYHNRKVLQLCMFFCLSNILDVANGLKNAKEISPEDKKQYEKQLKQIMRSTLLSHFLMELKKDYAGCFLFSKHSGENYTLYIFYDKKINGVYQP